MAETGRLKVSFQSDSNFLSGSLPVEVRDAGDVSVERSLGGLSRKLPAGLYTVRATMPGGQNHEEVVSVKPGESTEVVLTRADVGTEGLEGLESLGASDTSLLDVDLVTSLGTTSPATLLRPSSLSLVERHGCALDASDQYWTARPAGALTATPYAVFRLGDARISTSLPVNPEGGFPENACVVVGASVDGSARLVTTFARQRQVASTVEGLIRRNTLLSAPELLDQATELLYSKYSDPPAAALGGLTLHRLGRLVERTGWVENLARDFAWLPDGQVLLAALLSRHEDPHERGRGLESLLAAADDRPMFTEGFALLLELLRRWPEDIGADLRAEALARVAPDASRVDWDAVCLTLTRGADDA